MFRSLPHKLLIAILLCGGAYLCAHSVNAADFKGMVGIPGLGNKTYTSLPELINALYVFLISMGAVVGVIKIALAGVQYATTDIGGNKSKAKEDIKGVLLGLLILTAPYIVLSLINPKFTNLDVLKLETLKPSHSSSAPGPSASDVYVTHCPSCNPSTKDCSSYINACKPPLGTIENTDIKVGDDTQTVQTCKIPQGGTCPGGTASPPKQPGLVDCSKDGDSCTECQVQCDPDEKIPNDDCKAWKASCNLILGSYVDESVNDWECEVPFESVGHCTVLKGLGDDGT